LSSTHRSKLKKLKSFGGDIAGFTHIDVYTGHVDGILVNSMAKPLPLVKATVQAFKVKKHKQGRSLLRRSVNLFSMSPFLTSNAISSMKRTSYQCVVKPIIITAVLHTLNVSFVKSRRYKELHFCYLTQPEFPELQVYPHLDLEAMG
jgi:hypothetical protein